MMYLHFYFTALTNVELATLYDNTRYLSLKNDFNMQI